MHVCGYRCMGACACALRGCGCEGVCVVVGAWVQMHGCMCMGVGARVCVCVVVGAWVHGHGCECVEVISQAVLFLSCFHKSSISSKARENF